MIATRWLARPAVASARSADEPAGLRPSVVFWVATLTMAAAAMIRSGYVFTHPVHEQADDALNSMLVSRAEHADLLIGNYSRVGFHHPGPALLYILAGGQGLYRDVLHVVPGPYNGEILGAITFAAVLLGLAVLAVYRCTRSATATLVAAIACFVFATQHAMFGDPWFPCLYMSPFALFVVAGAAVAAGYTAELPSFVLAACLLTHGHASFLMFVGVTGLAVLASWRVRYRPNWRAELGAHRRAGYGSLALVSVSVLPLLLELVVHYPGPWRSYWHYLNTPNPPRTAGDVLRFFGWYWSNATLPIAVTVIAAVVAAAMMIIDPHRLFAFLYAMLGLQTVLFLVYLGRGVDRFDSRSRYVGFFYQTVPLLLVVGAAAHLAWWLTRRLDGLARQRLVVAALAGAVVVLGGQAVATQHARDRYRSLIPFPQVVAALDQAPDRRGRVVAFDFAHDRWMPVAGIGVAAQRRHVPWCIRNPDWGNLFTAKVCAPSDRKWAVRAVLPNEIPAAARVIWQDDQLALIEGDLTTPPLPV